MDEQLELMQAEEQAKMEAEEQARMEAEEIERLRLWDERVAREKEANDKEAAELAILIAEERKRPKESDRINALESAMLDMILGGA